MSSPNKDLFYKGSLEYVYTNFVFETTENEKYMLYPDEEQQIPINFIINKFKEENLSNKKTLLLKILDKKMCVLYLNSIHKILTLEFTKGE